MRSRSNAGRRTAEYLVSRSTIKYLLPWGEIYFAVDKWSWMSRQAIRKWAQVASLMSGDFNSTSPTRNPIKS